MNVTASLIEFGQYAPLGSLILSIIVVAIISYSPLVNYYKRPQLMLQPQCWGPEQNVRLFGFIVKNLGRNIAKSVYGVIESNSQSRSRIIWNDSSMDRIDILPGPLNECWFYVAKVIKVNGDVQRFRGSFSCPAKKNYEISVKLFWEYSGLKSQTRKFSLDLTTWEDSKILINRGSMPRE